MEEDILAHALLSLENDIVIMGPPRCRPELCEYPDPPFAPLDQYNAEQDGNIDI